MFDAMDRAAQRLDPIAAPPARRGPIPEGELPWRGLAPMSKIAPTPSPAPAPAASPMPDQQSPAAPASKPCLIATRTLAKAPGGAPDTRTSVGVGEQVELTASVPVKWMATAGSFGFATPPKLNAVTWTAPETAAACVITAQPPKGTVCTLTLNVVAPTERVLTKQSNLSYPAGRAGSGFVALGKLMPLDVSFSRVESREETVNAKADGYYKTVLRWDGISHDQGKWVRINADNAGFKDTVGTPAVGTAGPFSAGNFVWAIPQNYRVAGSSGDGFNYSTAQHTQAMTDATGEETTAKEGASRTRVP